MQATINFNLKTEVDPYEGLTAGQKSARLDWLKNHPFQYHLLRGDSGELTHVNSLFLGYNDDSGLIETDTNFGRKVICNTQSEIDEALKIDLRGRQKLYILTKLDCAGINQFVES